MFVYGLQKVNAQGTVIGLSFKWLNQIHDLGAELPSIRNSKE